MAFRKSFVTYKIKWKIFNLLSLKKILFFKGYFRKLAPTALRFCKDRDLTRIHFFYKQLSLSPSPQICLYFILLYFYSILTYSFPMHPFTISWKHQKACVRNEWVKKWQPSSPSNVFKEKCTNFPSTCYLSHEKPFEFANFIDIHE